MRQRMVRGAISESDARSSVSAIAMRAAMGLKPEAGLNEQGPEGAPVALKATASRAASSTASRWKRRAQREQAVNVGRDAVRVPRRVNRASVDGHFPMQRDLERELDEHEQVAGRAPDKADAELERCLEKHIHSPHILTMCTCASVTRAKSRSSRTPRAAHTAGTPVKREHALGAQKPREPVGHSRCSPAGSLASGSRVLARVVLKDDRVGAEGDAVPDVGVQARAGQAHDGVARVRGRVVRGPKIASCSRAKASSPTRGGRRGRRARRARRCTMSAACNTAMAAPRLNPVITGAWAHARLQVQRAVPPLEPGVRGRPADAPPWPGAGRT